MIKLSHIHPLKVHQKNYPIHDLVLAVIVFSLAIWRHYLYDFHDDVLHNYNSLQYFLNFEELNLRQRSG